MPRRAFFSPPPLERIGDVVVVGRVVVQGGGPPGGARGAAARAHDLLVPLRRVMQTCNARLVGIVGRS
jgi:hypothetical protein